MRIVTLLALGLMFAGTWPHDSARGQNSATPPVSLTPPHASPPHASPRNFKPRESSPPVIGAVPALPNPAADYDGFSASTDDSNAPSQVTPPVRPGFTRGTKGNDAQSLVDQEDEALKRKLTICKNCK